MTTKYAKGVQHGKNIAAYAGWPTARKMAFAKGFQDFLDGSPIAGQAAVSVAEADLAILDGTAVTVEKDGVPFGYVDGWHFAEFYRALCNGARNDGTPMNPWFDVDNIGYQIVGREQGLLDALGNYGGEVIDTLSFDTLNLGDAGGAEDLLLSAAGELIPGVSEVEEFFA